MLWVTASSRVIVPRKVKPVSFHDYFRKEYVLELIWQAYPYCKHICPTDPENLWNKIRELCHQWHLYILSITMILALNTKVDGAHSFGFNDCRVRMCLRECRCRLVMKWIWESDAMRWDTMNLNGGSVGRGKKSQTRGPKMNEFGDGNPPLLLLSRLAICAFSAIKSFTIIVIFLFIATLWYLDYNNAAKHHYNFILRPTSFFPRILVFLKYFRSYFRITYPLSVPTLFTFSNPTLCWDFGSVVFYVHVTFAGGQTSEVTFRAAITWSPAQGCIRCSMRCIVHYFAP